MSLQTVKHVEEMSCVFNKTSGMAILDQLKGESSTFLMMQTICTTI
jgi:hypothetical protein